MSPERILTKELSTDEKHRRASLAGEIILRNGSGSAEYVLATICVLNADLWRPVTREELVEVVGDVVRAGSWTKMNPISPYLDAKKLPSELIEPRIEKIIDGFLDSSIDAYTKKPRNLLTAPDNFELTEYGNLVLAELIVEEKRAE